MTTRILPHPGRYYQMAPKPHPIPPPAPAPAPGRSIEIVNITYFPGPGIIAIVDLRVGGIVIRQIRVSNYGRGTFVNFPARLVDGKWVELVEVASPALRIAMEDVVMLAMRRAK